MNFNQTVIAVNLEEEATTALSQIKDLPFTEKSTIHLVHVFELHNFSFDLIPNLNLKKDDYLAIEKWGEEKLQEVQKKLGLESHNCVLKCLISSNPRQEFLSYSDQVGASVVIAVAKEREGLKGLFESSFTSFLNKFSRANLILLRPQK